MSAGVNFWRWMTARECRSLSRTSGRRGSFASREDRLSGSGSESEDGESGRLDFLRGIAMVEELEEVAELVLVERRRFWRARARGRIAMEELELLASEDIEGLRRAASARRDSSARARTAAGGSSPTIGRQKLQT